MTTLTEQQINELRQRGLSDEKIQTLASQSGHKIDPKANFATGFVKAQAKTVKGLAELGPNIVKAFVPKKYEKYVPTPDTEKDFGGAFSDERLEYREGERLGGLAGEIAQYAIPGGAMAKATKGAGALTRIGGQMLSSGTVATAQSGRVGPETGIAVGVEAALPVAGKFVVKPATRLLGRLFKGVGSGVSGMGTQQIDEFLKQPKAAKESIGLLKQTGVEDRLAENTRTFVNGARRIRNEARMNYGKGLEQLAKEDIKPAILKQELKDTLSKYGISSKDGVLKIGGAEFTSPKNVSMAKELINKINGYKDLSGKGIRKLIDDIEQSAYKTTGGDAERLSFNAFVKDLANSLKRGVSKSTNKLDDINKAFASDMTIVQGIENVFGKMKYYNASEVQKAAAKLENLFRLKGLDPKAVDDFLRRIDIDPSELRLSEAVRQSETIVQRANTKGLSFGEMVQAVTSSVFTPQAVRDVAIFTGLSEPMVKEIFGRLSPTARGALIRVLAGNKGENPNDE